MEPIHLSLSLDRKSVPPGQRTLANLVVAVRAAGRSEAKQRPLLTVVFVLDTSASMRGPPLEHLIQSVERLVALLQPIDRVGIATFSQSATEVVSIRPVNAETKKVVHTTLHTLEAGAHTNMEAGLRIALGMMPDRRENERQLILLLSDGVPNIGLCTPLTLAEIVRKWRSQISVYTLGYGPHHQEDILAAISNAGGGRYEHIPEPQVCEFAFGKVLGSQGLVVADSAELSLRPSPGVDITRVLGKHELRYGAGGLIFNLPDVFAGSERLIVAELGVTPSRSGVFKAVNATLNFRSIENHEIRSIQRDLSVNVAEGEGVLFEEAHAGVLLVRCDDVRAEARAMADRGQFEGAAVVLAEMVRAIEKAPGFTAFDGSPLSDALEELRDELMVMERKPKAEEYKAYRRSQMNVSVSLKDHAVTASSHTDNVYANEIMRAVAGDYPVAHIEQLSGAEAGRKVPLRAEQVIGRAQSADVVIANPRVTRHHTKIIAQRGKFFVIDLGSANGTWLNEARIESHALNPGDIIAISDVKFRYQEDKKNAEARLMALTPDGNVYVVEKDRLFVIGSSRACTMVIESPKVGRQHAAVRFREGNYYLEDYGSMHGTYRPNGDRVTDRIKLQDGDEFVMGDCTVRFLFRA